MTVPDKAWRQARRRLKAVQPLLVTEGPVPSVEEVAHEHGVSRATVYRWLRTYAQTRSVASLVRRRPGPSKGRRCLLPAVEAVVQQAIEAHYLTLQKKNPTQVLREVKLRCHEAGLPAPSATAVNRRIAQVPAEERTRRRQGADIARDHYEPLKGHFEGGDYPLAAVQMDHALVDVELVDETHRRVVGRPFLTLAIDVYSRMVLGFYLSFDDPGAAGTGLCLVHAILPKEGYLRDLGIAGDWPCRGVMKLLHTDNAREFKGTMLGRACKKYEIKPTLRPPRDPHMGGHVERAIKTFLHEAHTIPGTTLSNPRQRGHYDSGKHAALTLSEFERWFTIFLVNVYHRRLHEGIQQVPYVRYQQGLAGLRESDRPRLVADELQLRLDFMPAEERTIQQYGVRIGHIHYYADVLRPYVNSVDPDARRAKRKFLFKRDPRDISCIYFLDPHTKVYHRIPYRDLSQPAMSAREYQATRKRLREQAKTYVDEAAIFAGYKAMREVELAGVAKTRHARLTKNQNRVVQGVPTTATTVFFQQGNGITNVVHAPVPADETPAPRKRGPILPYDNLEDGTFATQRGQDPGLD